MNKRICDIKSVELEKVKQESSLDKWFYEMVQKREDDLTIKDISHMLRQEIYLDIAISKAWEKIIENPLCGEMYEGQMLELLARVLTKEENLKEKELYTAFEKNLIQEYEKITWDNDYDKKEYEKIVADFRKIF